MTNAPLNYSTAVMLFDERIRAVNTIYKPDAVNADGTSKRNEVRTMYKTLDHSIKKGDLVVVPTEPHHRHGATVVMVDEVDVEVDFDSQVQVKWIVAKVDDAPYIQTLADEEKWIAQIKASETRKKRENIRANMKEMLAEVGVTSVPQLGGPTTDQPEQLPEA